MVVFFQAEDSIRDWSVTGVQTCALPFLVATDRDRGEDSEPGEESSVSVGVGAVGSDQRRGVHRQQIGRASCRERVSTSRAAVSSEKNRRTAPDGYSTRTTRAYVRERNRC